MASESYQRTVVAILKALQSSLEEQRCNAAELTGICKKFLYETEQELSRLGTPTADGRVAFIGAWNCLLWALLSYARLLEKLYASRVGCLPQDVNSLVEQKQGLVVRLINVVWHGARGRLDDDDDDVDDDGGQNF